MTSKERYYYLKERGLCVKCGQEKAYHGHTMCLSCAVADVERRAKRYRETHPDPRPKGRPPKYIYTLREVREDGDDVVISGTAGMIARILGISDRTIMKDYRRGHRVGQKYEITRKEVKT